MRSLFTLFLGAATICIANAQIAPRVIGGYDVKEDLYSWQVALNIEYENQFSFCGGSLISPQWILTAAHCLQKEGKPITANQVKVSHGSVLRSQMRAAPAVEKVYVHQDYNGTVRSEHDIALLYLSHPIQGQMMALSDHKSPWATQDGVMFKVSGWGALEEATAGKLEKLPDALKIVALPNVVKNTSVCGSAFNLQTQLCVGNLAGGEDSCSGDSGGPLFRGGTKKSPPVQYGIVSYGNGCARKGKAAVYTRVSHYIPWIKKQMGNDARSLRLINEPVAVLPPLPKLSRGDRALLIGVSRYYLPGLKLTGPEKDVENMRHFLIHSLDFKNDQIYTLSAEQATSTNIRQLVKKWLIDQTGSGDQIWLYFSGHGAYYPDISGDEKEIDAQVGVAVDETILPYDTDLLTSIAAPKTGSQIPITSGHILDDEINQWLQEMKGRQVNVVFDSCHSGTATRNMTLQREKSGIKALLKALPNSLNAKTTLHYPLQTPQKNVVTDGLDHVVFWSATKSSETAKDGPPGLFTTAFIAGAQGKADSNSDGAVTYAELLKFVRDKTRLYQMTPQLEIADARLGYSILTNQPIANVPVALDNAMANDNPYGLKLEMLDKDNNIIHSPPYCPQKPCPKYHLRVSAKKGGLLLIYFLDDNGRGRQALPNSQWVQRPEPLKDGETRDLNFTFEIDEPTPGIILGILLDPAETSNYQKIDQQFSQESDFDALTLRKAIDQRDNVLLGADRLAPVSTVTIPLLR